MTMPDSIQPESYRTSFQPTTSTCSRGIHAPQTSPPHNISGMSWVVVIDSDHILQPPDNNWFRASKKTGDAFHVTSSDDWLFLCAGDFCVSSSRVWSYTLFMCLVIELKPFQRMWWTITGNFGNILPIDWSKTYTRQLHTKVLNLGEKREPEVLDLDLSDDEELAQAFDMHSLIISSLQPEESDHVASAEEVISEIDNMMQEPDLDDVPMGLEGEIPEDLSYTKLKETLANLPAYPEAELKGMSNTELHEVLAEYELTIKELNETLVHELALRDELEYDKELKNQFISLLLTIQKKRREGNVEKKKKKKCSANNNDNTTSPGSYLTTVIPYHLHQGPPTSEQLQIYIKILQAINEDSQTVPTLLTDYILKVLCPT